MSSLDLLELLEILLGFWILRVSPSLLDFSGFSFASRLLWIILGFLEDFLDSPWLSGLPWILLDFKTSLDSPWLSGRLISFLELQKYRVRSE